MAVHATTVGGEPVAIAYAITAGLGLVAGALNLTLSNGTVTLISTLLWFVISAVATVIARNRVSPIAGGWKAEVRDIVTEVVQDVVSTQLNLTTAIAPSGQPAYVPAQPPPMPSAGPVPVLPEQARLERQQREMRTRPTPAPRVTTPPTDAASIAERASRWTDSPLRADSGTTRPQPRPGPGLGP